MNKKITVIELLNKIVNGEEIPEKILYLDKVFYLQNDEFHQIKFYETDTGVLLLDIINSTNNLLDEVEILEDNTEEIEELDEEWTYIEGQVEKTWSNSELELVDKINELVRVYNKLRKEKQ